MLKIELKLNQCKLISDWLEKQSYLTDEEVSVFKDSFREYGVEFNIKDLGMVIDECPFGFIIYRIEDFFNGRVKRIK